MLKFGKKQKIACLLLLLTSLSACEKNKEEQLKSQLSGESAPKISAVEIATTTPNFQNETNAGLELSAAGQNDKALEFFEKALERSPTSPIALNNVCSGYNNLKQWAKAIEECKKAAKVAPDFQLAKNNLEFAQTSLQNLNKEIESLTASVAKAPSEKKRPMLVDLGFKYYSLNDYQEAVKIWKSVPLENDSLTITVLNNLGSAYIQMKEFSSARESLSAAQAKDPQNQLVKNNLSWLSDAEKISAKK